MGTRRNFSEVSNIERMKILMEHDTRRIEMIAKGEATFWIPPWLVKFLMESFKYPDVTIQSRIRHVALGILNAMEVRSEIICENCISVVGLSSDVERAACRKCKQLAADALSCLVVGAKVCGFPNAFTGRDVCERLLPFQVTVDSNRYEDLLNKPSVISCMKTYILTPVEYVGAMLGYLSAEDVVIRENVPANALTMLNYVVVFRKRIYDKLYENLVRDWRMNMDDIDSPEKIMADYTLLSAAVIITAGGIECSEPDYQENFLTLAEFKVVLQTITGKPRYLLDELPMVISEDYIQHNGMEIHLEDIREYLDLIASSHDAQE